jgi:Spy/CpxP family protein refolding chaperone
MAMRGLDLTEAQKASMKAIAEKHREIMKPKLEAMAEAKKAMHQAMIDPATPVEQLKALHDKASQAQFELVLNRRAMMQESLAILTPEQKAKAEKQRAAHPGGPKRGMFHGRGMRPGRPGPETK